VTDELVALPTIEVAGIALRSVAVELAGFGKKNKGDGRMDWMGNWAKGKSVDRLAGGRLKGCKERGEWAEIYFLMQAAGLGLRVSRPFSNVGRYDVGVENRRRVLRVQVKSTLYKRRSDEYSLNVMGPQRKMYQPGTVDFFAVLLIPVDEWYIIPYEVLGEANCTLHLRPAGGKQLYQVYREAWHLLEESELVIQACADGEWELGECCPELQM